MTNKLLLLLVALMLAMGLARAQVYPNAPIRVDITGYKGNTVSSDSLTLLPSDTAKALSVAVSYREGGVPVPALAPTLIRKKLKVVVRWTLSPPFTDGWYQLMAGGQAIRYGAVHITTQGLIVPNTSANLITSIIAQLAQTFGTGKLDVSAFNAFVNANTIALGLKFNTTDTTAFVRKYAGYRLMSVAEGVKLAGLPDGATYTSTVSGINSAIDLLKPREFETFADAMAARATAPPVSQEWIVKHDETAPDSLGVPQRIIYKWSGTALLYAPYSAADGSPGTPSYNTQIDNINAALTDRYTKAQVSTLLQGYYLPVTVPNKAGAIAAATGTQPKIITVLIDDSDSNRPRNKYIYDGDSQPLGYPLF